MIPSFIRLMQLQWTPMTEQVDLTALGHLALALGRDAAASIRQREALGDRLRVVDAQYQDLDHTPLDVIREIYDVHGQQLTAAAADAFERWQQEFPPQRFGTNRYSLDLARYGLTVDAVTEAFSVYLSRFPAVSV